MIQRLLTGATIMVLAACATPATGRPAADIWPCRDEVRVAAIHAYALARNRDEQRAVILLPAGKAAAAYEAETKRLRDEGARLLGVLKTYDPEAERLPGIGPLPASAMTDAAVAGRIAAADACVSGLE